ncbi:MAG: SAM-dependent chlorinase/fluorinase, partial [Pseudomonadota bacterium]
MITLFSDFSVSDPYVGLMKMAIYQHAPKCQVIDICHDLPIFNPNASGRLLQMLVHDFPQESIVIAVVDPGVGTERHPLWLEVDGKHFIGPDNGLFARIANQGSDIKAHVLEYDVD